jgi:hypothetical protein
MSISLAGLRKKRSTPPLLIALMIVSGRESPGEHHANRSRPLLADLGEQKVAAQAGHVLVDDDHVGGLAAHELERLVAVVGLQRLHLLALQRAAQ